MGRGGTEAFHFPELGPKKVDLNEREMEMATGLVEDLTGDPSKYRDTYRDDLLARVKAARACTSWCLLKLRRDPWADYDSVRHTITARVKRSLGIK